ncbi:MAG: hypothetical protein K9H49_01755 [Bacteroidales bacterium]|nr:hypothetical protein [Bacteroidales bacterium]MCF8404650.1 hypothetical protein [Bacteroidales bacterium]
MVNLKRYITFVGIVFHFCMLTAQEYNCQETDTTKEIPLAFCLEFPDQLCPVKTQPTGGCWASASNTVVESYWLRMGFNAEHVSDKNLQLFHGFVRERNVNGNYMMATAYYTRGSGPVRKNEFNDTTEIINPELSYLNTGARYLPGDPYLIKRVIHDCSPVYTMLYFRKSNVDTVTQIHYTEKSGINHALALIGWNDTLTTKSGRGVWIAQNTLGELFGDNGRVYIPYQDKNILEHNAIWPEWETFNPRLQILYYDTLGPILTYGFNDSICWGMVNFTASDKGSVNRVGVFVKHPGTRIYAEVYKKFEPVEKVLSGLEGKSDAIRCIYPGYYTINLDKPVSFQKGEDFFVVVRYQTPDQGFPMPIEQYQKDYADPDITQNRAWINPDFEKWPNLWYEVGENSNLAYLKFDLCIRAYFILDK